MKIKKVVLVSSQIHIENCPNDGRPEYAFFGRSNVGKSSLINLLTGRKKIAFTSSKPGKTKLINHFLINNRWYLVDLPGYGYTQKGRQKQNHLYQIIDKYIFHNQGLTFMFLLVDPRCVPQKNDLEQIQFLGENKIPFAIVFTKIDKLSRKKLNENIKKYQNVLLKTWEELPKIFHSSSKKKTGKEEILAYIEKVNKIFLTCV